MAEDSIVWGKRKPGESDGEKPPGSTIFVSNLPYTATSTDLKTLFSDFAPVRSAFVVLEDGKSKGVGYVSFAIREDAKSTLETIEKDGLELNGRELRVQMADRKAKEQTDKPKIKGEHKSPNPSKPAHTKLPKDPNSIRTIVISGLPNPINKKALWKKVRKHEGAEAVELVEGESGVALVRFSIPAAAARAVDKLHAHVFKGAILSVTLMKRLENLAKTPLKKEGATSTTVSAAPSRGSRLIVRNLPWDISEKDLRTLFLPYGPVYSISIPTKESSATSGDVQTISKSVKNTKPRTKGFAFVWFFSKKDAECAIEGVNGRAVEAGTIVAPTLNKKERQRLRRQLREQNRNGGSGEPDGDEKDGDGDRGRDDEEVSPRSSKKCATKARVLAVDWALSKDKWEEAKAQMLGDLGTVASDSESESGDKSWSDDQSEPDSGKKGSESEMDVDEAWDVQESEEEEEERSDADEAQKATLPQTDVGTTVFVRNVPFEATEDELRVLFRAFGPLRYARITIDHETGRSRGTGFVCFWNKEDADKAIHQSELLKRETVTSIPGQITPKKNPFSLPSLLTPDPSSSLAHSLALHGRTLDVACAVTRDEAALLKDEGERQREKTDKRNLYLLREGVVLPKSPAVSALPPGEVEKRQASFTARRNLLKSNPSLYVSKTRLSIRQLPPFVSDRALKRFGLHAVRAFEEEVKRGDREPLTTEELRADKEEQTTTETLRGATEIKSKKDGRFKKRRERETVVKQAKVVRQADRVDSLTGKGRSRGYGFLEMSRHGDALRVLRWANNNNQTVNQLFEVWWKSEVEDMVKTLEKTRQTDAPKATKPKADEDAEKEEAEVRLPRLKAELERLQPGSSEGKKIKRTLIVEFSIENAQVIKRRKEKIEGMKAASKRVRSDAVSDVSGDEEDDVSATASPPKRRKIEITRSSKRQMEGTKDLTKSGRRKTESEAKDGGPARAGEIVGNIIGRKRKMRKARSKSKT